MTTKGQRYAKSTSVSVDRSERQLKELLRRYGADEIMTYESTVKGIAAVAFRVNVNGNDRNVRLTLPLPNFEDYCETDTGKERAPAVSRKSYEQACRARWRLLLLLVQAKLEAVESEISTFDREFLADVLLPSGETFFEAVEAGKADKLLGPPGKHVPLLPKAMR